MKNNLKFWKEPKSLDEMTDKGSFFKVIMKRLNILSKAYSKKVFRRKNKIDLF